MTFRTGWFLMACVVLISIVTFPRFNTEKPTIQEVFYCGWMTAVSTGLGVIPFIVFKEPNKLYMGISNAVAGGSIWNELIMRLFHTL